MSSKFTCNVVDNLKWPAVNTGNIFQYILDNKAFDSKYIGQYKAQKAYSYFKSGFVGKIECHDEPQMQRILIRAKVLPSQKVNDPHRKVWVLLKKSGKIMCAYCSCTAGLCRCCNHVIAVLYKVEHAVSHGMTQFSCTSLPCQWNKPSDNEIAPMTIREITFEKHSKMNPNPSKSLKRGLYDPRPVSKRSYR